MKKQFLFLFAALMIFVSFDSNAQAIQDFTIVNYTGVMIYQVYVSPHNANDWGEDILDLDVLGTNEYCNVSFHPLSEDCMWDLSVADSEGNYIVWENIDLCTWTVVTLYWDGKNATATFE